MNHWKNLENELKAWMDEGKKVKLWWRDDDAADLTDSFKKLLDLITRGSPPIVIAAIPSQISSKTVTAINTMPNKNIFVAQHGYSHSDNSSLGQKKIELGGEYSLECIKLQLKIGRAILEKRFPKRFVPVLVPPWNRIDPEIIPHLSHLNYLAISAFGTEDPYVVEIGLKELNCHIDIINWRNRRRFLGQDNILSIVCQLLRKYRSQKKVHDLPIGLLSHHIRHDKYAWSFLEKFFDFTYGHPAVDWPDLHMLVNS